jgi:hypothetical protein
MFPASTTHYLRTVIWGFIISTERVKWGLMEWIKCITERIIEAKVFSDRWGWWAQWAAHWHSQGKSLYGTCSMLYGSVLCGSNVLAVNKKCNHPKCQQLCIQCNMVEDTLHFIMPCNIFSTLRNELMIIYLTCR